MDQKAISDIKASWKPLMLKGGFFGLALNDFAKQPDRLPIFVCSVKKEVLKSHVTAAAGEDGDASKLILGKVALEGGKLCFNIDAGSPVKSPAALKKALKRLSKEKELGMAKAAKALVRLGGELSLEGDAHIDTSTEAKKQGGEVSKSAKLKKFFTKGASRYEKLLGALDTWHNTFHEKLSAENVAKGEQLLTVLEERTKDWLDQHSDEEGGDRKQEVQRIQREVAAAKKQIAAFKLRLASEEQDSADEDLIDDLLEGNDDSGGDAVKRAENIQRAKQSLQRRLAAQDLDEEERSTLAGELEEIQKLESAQVDKMLPSLKDIPQKGPRRQAMKQAQDNLTLRLSQKDLPEKDKKTLLESADTLLKTMRDDLKGDTFGETEHGKEQMKRTLSLLETMKGAGADEKLITERKLKMMKAIKKMNDAFVRSQKDAPNWEGALGRSNNALTGARTELVKDVGQDFAQSVLGDGLEAIRSNSQASLKSFDEETSPGATKAANTLANATSQIDNMATAIRQRLETVALKKCAAYGIARDTVISALNKLVEPVPLGGGDAPPLPSPAQVLSHILASDPTATQRYRDETVNKIKAYLEKTAFYDTNPKNTQRLIADQIDLHIQQGKPVNINAILKAIPPPGHWMARLDPDGFEDRMATHGFLSEDDLEEEQKAIQDNDKARQDLVAFRDTTFQDARTEFEDKAKLVIGFLGDTFKGVMDKVLADPKAIPEPIRQLILGVMQTAIDSGGDPQKCRVVVADILVLRWLAPLLSTTPFPNPKAGGKEMPSTTGGYLGKLMQNVANGTLPREADLLSLHPLLKTYTTKYNQFVDDLLQDAKDDL